MSTTPDDSALLIPRRFCGPPSSGNGGWTAGALAGLLTGHEAGEHGWPTVEVTLRQPPPLDVLMPVEITDDGGTTGTTGTASHNDAVVASARILGSDGELPILDPAPFVEPAAAAAVESTYPGLVSHPFPTCFSCGVARDDGLRIFPGQISDGLVAARWTPAPSESEDYHAYTDHVRCAALATTWAAIDCIGGWASDFGPRLMVLGRMTATVRRLPHVGDEHVVVGQHRRNEGRKSYATTSLYDAKGELVAAAEQVWLTVQPSTFGQVALG